MDNQQFNQQTQVPQGHTKKCKHCQSDIPKKAKVCSVCHKKQGGIGKWIAIVIVVFILIGALGGGKNETDTSTATNTNTSSNTNVETSTSSEPKEEEKTSFSVGETAMQNDVNVTLVSVTESTGAQYVTPEDGKVFLVCEFEIANNSSSDISVSSMMSFEAYCDDYSILQDILGLQVDEAAGKNQLDGSIAAGKK